MVPKPRIVSDLNRRYSRNFCRGFSDGATIFSGHQQINIATNLLRRGNRVQGCYANFAIVVFDYYQVTHD